MKKGKQVVEQKVVEKDERLSTKLPDSIKTDLKDCYDFFDTEGTDSISRDNLKSIMGNFGWGNSNSKEIEEILVREFDSKEYQQRRKEKFSFDEVLEFVAMRFVKEGGKEAEFDEMFNIFDKRGKGEVDLTCFKAVFEQFFDINITDEDINNFIERISGPGEKTITKQVLCNKMGYS